MIRVATCAFVKLYMHYGALTAMHSVVILILLRQGFGSYLIDVKELWKFSYNIEEDK
jgi:hypothetical protein